MQRGLGGTVFDPVEQPRDRELTVGPAMLVALACALLALCGLCFVFGFAMGHRGSESPTALLPDPGKPVAAQSVTPASKPSAGQSGAQPQQAAAPTDQPDTSDTDSTAGSTPEPVSVSTTPGSGTVAASPGVPAVRTALAGQPAPAQPVPAGGRVEPAIGLNAGIMVQIAAVSHPEDADVLVSALRKRGYTVGYRHDPADGLLHVQIGPFANRSDALAMRQRLLNDGYNAIVQ